MKGNYLEGELEAEEPLVYSEGLMKWTGEYCGVIFFGSGDSPVSLRRKRIRRKKIRR